MNSTRLLPFAALFVLLASCTTLREPAPYRTRIQSPSQLVAIQPLPRAAKVLPAGEIGAGMQFDWSNIWGREDSGTLGCGSPTFFHAFPFPVQLVVAPLQLLHDLGGKR